MTYLVITLLGFARHEALQIRAWERILATFIPFYFAWLVTAPWLGLFNPAVVRNWRRIWRAPLATFYAAPIGGLLRGVWLGSPVLPLFVLIMAGVSAGLIFLWRAFYLRFVRAGRQAP